MADYWTEVLADSPKILLKMDESSGSLVDSSGNSHGSSSFSGTAVTYHASGPDATGIPYAITFSNTSTFTVNDHADLDLGDGPFSIEIWCKRAAAGTSYSLLKKNTTNGYGLVWNADSFRLNNNSISNIRSTPTETDLGWHHWVFTRPLAAFGKVYRDGVDVTNTSNTMTFVDNSDNMTIGNDFAGSLAGIAIYKSVLTSTRVNDHYNARSTAGGGGGGQSSFDPMGMSGFFGI